MTIQPFPLFTGPSDPALLRKYLNQLITYLNELVGTNPDLGGLIVDTLTGVVYTDTNPADEGLLVPLYASLAVGNTLEETDAAAVAAGVPLVIDVGYALTENYTITAAQVFFRPTGVLTLGDFNLVLPVATYADPYSKIFVQIPNGGVATFAGRMLDSPCWWGADPTGNMNAGVELATREAFQFAEIALDTNGGVVFGPPGHYILDAGATVLFRNSHHVANPRTFRLDFDPATVPAVANPIIALFGGGNPNTRQSSGQKLPGWTAGTNAAATNCSFLGAYDPAKVLNGNVWTGWDIIHDPTGQAFLGNNKFLIGLYIFGGFNLYIADSNFIGLPCDGLNIWGGGGTLYNIECSLNGFYGGANFANGTTRNGCTISGWFDVRTPYLTTDTIRVLDSRFKANAGTGLAPGGCSADTLIDGCSTIGNGNIAYELILFDGEDLTQYQNIITVAVGDNIYTVRTTGEPPNLGGSVWQCSIAGTTSSSGTGPVGALGAAVADGTATFVNIGSMPANGRIPALYSLANTVDEGSIPASVNVPWLGGIAVPAFIQGNGVSTGTHIAMNAGNEKRLSIKNVLGRNFGYVGNTSPICSIISNNGGEVEIDGYELDNCYGSVGGGMVALNLGSCPYWPNLGATPYQGKASNNKPRVRIRNVRFNNPTMAATAAGLIDLRGNLFAYDIDGVISNAIANGFLIFIDHAKTVASTLQYGRISNCECGGTPGPAIVLNWATGTGSSVTNGIDLQGNRLFNCGASYTFGSSGGAVQIQAGAAATIAATIRLTAGNIFSYAGPPIHPITTNNINNNSMLLVARGNRMAEGAYYPFGTSVKQITASAAFYKIDANDNGLAGDSVTYGTAVPTTGTYQLADMARNLTPSASNPDYWRCTNPGSLTGAMNACSVTIANGAQTGTYTLGGGGVPPLPGEWVTFASGPTGSNQVAYANNGNIGFVAAVNNSAASVLLSYYTVVVFKAVNLAA